MEKEEEELIPEVCQELQDRLDLLCLRSEGLVPEDSTGLL
jgi:hypothetical protein